jgi:hypothetical protein
MPIPLSTRGGRGHPDDDEDEGVGASLERVGDARSIADGRKAARASYGAMVVRLGNAWRTPFGDGVQPSGHTRPGVDPREPSGVTDPDAAQEVEAVVERTRGKRGPVTEADVERFRRSQDAKNRQRLANAWRRP